jgi:hypothetical protein
LTGSEPLLQTACPIANFVILLNQSNSTTEVSKNVKHLKSSSSGGLGGILPLVSRESKRIYFFFLLLTGIIPVVLQAKSGRLP